MDILNVSPYLLGGLRASLRLVALAEAARASVLISGTTQELNLGTAGAWRIGRRVADSDHPGDNTGPQLYMADVVKAPVQYENSHLLVPEGPGLGSRSTKKNSKP